MNPSFYLRRVIASGITALASLTLPAAADTIFQDDFTTAGIDKGGLYTSTLAGTAPTVGSGTWLGGVETGGWGQTGDGRATPTSSNFLAFTPDPNLTYTVQATIDTTGAADLNDSWFTLGFTSSQHNWNGADSATIDTAHLVRFNDATTSTITYTLSGATLVANSIGYVGWITSEAGVVNLDPANEQVKITNFSLTAVASGVPNPTVTYDGNGSDGGVVPTDGSSPYTSGATVTVLGTGTMTRAGYYFQSWNTAAAGSGTNLNPGATFTILNNTTLYARWMPVGDYLWNNGAATGTWNETDANWSGVAWTNSAANNAFFTSVGGTVNLATITAGSVNVGNTGSNFADITLIDGSLSAASLTAQGFSFNGSIYANNPTLRLDSTVTISGDTAVGRANLNITGGTLTTNRIISSAASADWARLVVSGGTVIATNGVDGSVNTTVTFALDLNGGELHAPSIRVADREIASNNAAWLTFNGGILKAIGADNADFITTYGGGQNTFVASGGAIIDTNGRNIGIQVNLLDAGGAGGLTKHGAGILTLSGTYSYTGATYVTAGTLDLATTTLNDAAIVDVGSTAVLKLPVGSTDTVADFLINGVSQGPGTWNSGNTGGRITGGSLFVAAADPFLAWIGTFFPGETNPLIIGATADPDNDGIENLVEYVLKSGNPDASSTGILPTLDASGANFVFTYLRRTAASGTTQTFQYGSNLTGWTDVPVTNGGIVSITSPEEDIEQVVITVPKGANTKLFGRLQVVK